LGSQGDKDSSSDQGKQFRRMALVDGINVNKILQKNNLFAMEKKLSGKCF
jgi:hypothetical protein